jgi:hypothetical protein
MEISAQLTKSFFKNFSNTKNYLIYAEIVQVLRYYIKTGNNRCLLVPPRKTAKIGRCNLLHVRPLQQVIFEGSSHP